MSDYEAVMNKFGYTLVPTRLLRCGKFLKLHEWMFVMDLAYVFQTANNDEHATSLVINRKQIAESMNKSIRQVARTLASLYEKKMLSKSATQDGNTEITINWSALDHIPLDPSDDEWCKTPNVIRAASGLPMYTRISDVE